MSTKKKKISDLKEALEIDANDWFVIEKREGTRKIQAGTIGINDNELQDLKDKLSKVNEFLSNKFPISYIKPTLNLSSNKGIKFELGTTINTTITSEFIQNDAGAITKYKLTKGAVVVKEVSNIEAFTDSFKLTEDVQYKAEISYAIGPIKNDSLGKPNSQGQIQAGTISNTLTIMAARAVWGYASSSTNTPSVNDIRNSTVTGVGLQEGSTIKVTARAGSARTIIFAYPSSLRDCSKIRYDELGDDGNKTAFNQTTLSIPDASGQNSINYRVYYYTAPILFSSNATFILTI